MVGVVAPVTALVTAVPPAPVTALATAVMPAVRIGPLTGRATALATAVPRGPVTALVTAVMTGAMTAVTIGVPPAPVNAPVNALAPGAMPLVMIGAVTDPATVVTTAAPLTRPETAMADLRCGLKDVKAAGLFATTNAMSNATPSAMSSARALPPVPLK